MFSINLISWDMCSHFLYLKRIICFITCCCLWGVTHKVHFRDPAMLKNRSQLLIFADTSSFYLMSAIFYISLAPFCKRISLQLLIYIFHLQACLWQQEKKAQGGHINGQIGLFKTLQIRLNSSRHHMWSNFHLQSHYMVFLSFTFTCSTFTASSETDSIYIISRTYNNTQ